MNQRDYNSELLDTEDHAYGYDFDFDVMHKFMIESFVPFFNTAGNILELGSYKGHFTKRLLKHFDSVTCVEAAEDAINYAKSRFPNNVTFIHSKFEDLLLTEKFDNIVLTHVLEHLDNPVDLLKMIKTRLSPKGRLLLACPNANAPSRQIAVQMGRITHNTAVTESEKLQGHRITYTHDTLERDVRYAGLKVIHRSGIFFKALANFQWDKLLKTDIISEEYLEGCYQLGQKYPELCSSIFLVCEKN
jgi:2-polyprenyl-3-methyl-5-hydroxy-6-metoxy-1,4-benzoquinol methylase